MSFKMKYDIISDLLPTGTKRRPGGKINVKFLVAHDTGNPGSTAKGNINYYRNSPTIAASAQIFVDDECIRECIPAVLGTPERAYHVIYNVTTDNRMFGADANDAAIGVELCWGGNIDGAKSYARYVWILAYLCYKFGLDPKRDIVGHETLDPKRKIDPSNGLKHIGKTYNQLITDVAAEYKECSGKSAKPQTASVKSGKTHKVVSGDTLYKIANEYGTTVAKLKALNPEIDVLALQIGSTLLIQEESKTTDSGKSPIYGTISKNSPTLSHLAVDYKTTVANIEKLNPGINPLKLQIGQKVLVGYKSASTPSSNTAKKTSTKKVDPRLAEYLKHKPVRPYPGSPVKRGAHGKDVEAIQRALKISVDGDFGVATEKAVKNYQSKFSFLGVDGIVGYNTWNVMF
ncbi:LysM peptidoglycan-binding domain-containing protein [Bacillus subtilis]|uniref:LysM peptidoglycan-binding domain-containing protein n=1 Tax=Bacillus subtilis TaxID=1423 RepID=UPI00132AF7D6|nr:LysM peptidoglycan-binding domain-containing protein [Bacillus subtilis]MEC2266516.1 LysM peptidoglycan-binding domain-containing protein [Bacillus subtilis]MUG00742.1 LysM peptidoglycan-binding domain-containing protein [Bacillus tequilensis]